jgi:hypothetical protein
MEKGSLRDIGAGPGDLVICIDWDQYADDWDKVNTDYKPGDICGVKLKGFLLYLDIPGNWTGQKAIWAIHKETYDVGELL